MNALPPPLWTAQWRDVEIQIFSTGDDSPLSLQTAVSMLSDEENARASRFHFQDDCERWMRARALLRLSIAGRLGRAAHEIEFTTGPFGKLELAGFDGEKPPLEFNLSHSRNYMVVAVSEQPVGVDFECWIELPVEELSAFTFRPEEHREVIADTEPQCHFLKLWTAKEAVLKCTGLGLSLPPSAVAVRCGEGGLPEFAECAEAGGAFALYCACHPGSWMLTTAQRA